jgi:hypothetical protein
MTTPDQNEPNEPQVSPRLSRSLRGLRKTSVFISPTVDEAVLERAKRHLAKIRAQRLRHRQTQWLALAASVVLLVLLAQTVLNGNKSKRFAREDLNHDKRVDILDAFQLARELRDGQARPIEDFNGDGKVDAADVEFLAKRAVSLEKGGRS